MNTTVYFTKVGPIRIVVAKHNKESSPWGKRITIIHTDIFELKLVANKENDYVERNWAQEEWDCHGEHIVDYILKNEPNGLYEIVGDLYHRGWVSGHETPEYNSDMDVRDEKFQQIGFYQAYSFDDNDVLKEEVVFLTRLLEPEPDDSPIVRYYDYDWNTEIHHYMKPHQILLHHANALSALLNRGRTIRTSCQGMNDEELKNFIDMCMFEIDSESEKSEEHKKMLTLALRMEDEVQKTLAIREEMFNEKSGEVVDSSD